MIRLTQHRRVVFSRCYQLACLVFLIFFIVVIAGCAEKKVESPPPPPILVTPTPGPEVILRLHGSNALATKLIPDLAEAFLKKNGADNIVRLTESEADKILVQGVIPEKLALQVIEIIAQDSGMAFKNLAAGTCDIGLASRKIDQQEIQELSSLGDMTSRKSENVVALDGIAIIVHRDNPINTLSIDQIIKIFTGEIQNWSDVNGEAGPIKIYALDDNSGTYEAFQQTVLVDKQLADSAERIPSDVVLSERVSADKASIGFVKLAYARESKTIGVTDGESLPLSPDKFNVGTEDYLLSHRLYLYLPESSENTTAREFIDFALSQEGQKIVALNDFVDLNITLRSITLVSDSSAKDLVSDTDTKKLSPEAREYIKIKIGADKLSLNIRFRYNSSDLDNKAQRDIDRIVEFLKRNEEYKERGIALLGFTDAKGAQRYNIKLSEKRAQSVAQQLRDRGINSSLVIGLGKENPVATNETEEGQAKNRRVEAWLLNSDFAAFEGEEFDPDRNSGGNRTAKGATVIPVNGMDPKGTVDYDKGDKTDWYQVNIGEEGTLTYQVQQNTPESTLSVQLYYSAKSSQEVEDNRLDEFSLRGKEEHAFTIEKAKPGIYYAKVFVENPGETSAYKISNTFASKSGKPQKPAPTSSSPLDERPEPTPNPTTTAVDITPPTIIISFPEQNSTTTEETVAVTGKVEGASEIALLKINDATVPLEGGKGFIPEKEQYVKEFAYQVASLKMGENSIEIAAWDKVGNIGTTTLRVVREAASPIQAKPTATPTPETVPTQVDTHPPIITIISPEPNSVVTADAVAITVKVADDSKIQQIAINDKPITLAGTRGFIVQEKNVQEFTHQVTDLKPGLNVISIAVWDEFGNIGTATIQITRQ